MYLYRFFPPNAPDQKRAGMLDLSKSSLPRLLHLDVRVKQITRRLIGNQSNLLEGIRRSGAPDAAMMVGLPKSTQESLVRFVISALLLGPWTWLVVLLVAGSAGWGFAIALWVLSFVAVWFPYHTLEDRSRIAPPQDTGIYDGTQNNAGAGYVSQSRYYSTTVRGHYRRSRRGRSYWVRSHRRRI